MKSLTEAIQHWATAKADQPAFVDADAGKTWTWSEFSKISRGFANSLHSLNKKPGEPVLVRSRHGIFLPGIVAGCWEAGLLPIVVSEEQTEHEFEILRAVLNMTDQLVISAETFQTSDSTDNPGPESNFELALGILTSGTTATPKLITFTHENLVEAARIEAENEPSYVGATIANLRPPFTSAGLNTLWPSLLLGATNVFSEKTRTTPVARFLRKLIDDHQISHLIISPAYIQSLMNSVDETPISSRPVSLYFGGTMQPPRTIETLYRNGLLPTMRYGMTEAGHILSKIVIPKPPETIEVGSVGKPFTGFATSVVNGRLAIDSPGAADFQIVDGKTQSLKTKGVFTTDDKCSILPSGEIRLEGREYEQIVANGFRFHPKQVEEVLSASGLLKDVRVIGHEDLRLGQEVVAIGVLPLESSPSDVEKRLRELAQQKLSPFKRPRRYVFIEKWPALPNGKVDLVALKSAAKIKN